MGSATAVALIASGYLAWAPAYAGEGAQATASAEVPGQVELSEGSLRTTRTTRTLAEVNGPHVYLLLAIPVFLAGLPLFLRANPGRAVASVFSALLLIAFVIVTGFSIGRFYTVAAQLALVGAIGGSLLALVDRSKGEPLMTGEGASLPEKPSE